MNRKILFLAISLLIVSHTLFAQVRFGVKGGLNVSKVVITNNDSDKNYQYTPSFHLGGYAIWSFCNTMGVTTEILYSDKGVKEPQTSIQSEARLHLHYLTVPILFNYKPITNFYIQAGPEVGYLLSANSRYDNKSHNLNNIYENKIDISAAIGLNYYITNKINVGARYIHGLSSLLDVDARDDTGMPLDKKVKYQNRVLQVSLGYTFGKKA